MSGAGRIGAGHSRLRPLALARTAASLLVLIAILPAHAFAQNQYCTGPTPPDSLQTADFAAPMQYRAETRDDRKILIAVGEIQQSEASRLAQALDAYRPDEVWFHSPGGVAVAGPQMGRELRRRRLLVRVPQNAICFSACSLAFLGGEVRLVEPGGYYGVHVFSGVDGSLVPVANQILGLSQRFFELPVQQRQQSQTQGALLQGMIRAIAPIQQQDALISALIARYLVEMSLSLDLLTDMFGTAYHERCWVSRAGLVRYNIVNTD